MTDAIHYHCECSTKLNSHRLTRQPPGYEWACSIVGVLEVEKELPMMMRLGQMPALSTLDTSEDGDER